MRNSFLLTGFVPENIGRFAVIDQSGRGRPARTGRTEIIQSSAVLRMFNEKFYNLQFNNSGSFEWDEGSTSISNYEGYNCRVFAYPSGGYSNREQRWDLGIYTPRLWIEYYVYVPYEFLHVDRAGESDNNKWIQIWRDIYSDSTSGSIQFGWEYVPIDQDDNVSTDPSGSRIRVMARRYNYVLTSADPFGDYDVDGQNSPFISASGTNTLRPGKWNNVRVRIAAASNSASQDGIQQMWINGELHNSITTGRFWNRTGSNGEIFYPTTEFRNGYFMGASNSGFPVPTTFRIRDVSFYTEDPQWSSTVTGAHGTPFFVDPLREKRSSGSYFTWSTTSAAVTESIFSGSGALKFSFGPDEDLEDSSAEQRMTFKNVRAVWMSYASRYPSNYAHRNQSSGATNNKFIRIWGDDYNAVNKIGASTWYSPSDTRGAIRIDRNPVPNYGIGPGSFNGDGGSPTVALTVDTGSWDNFQIYARMPSASGSNDGEFRVLKNGIPLITWSNFVMSYDEAIPYWNRAYIYGAANSGFTQSTDIYVRNFKIYEYDPEWPSGSVSTFTDISRDAASMTGGDKVRLTVSGIVNTPAVFFGEAQARDITIVDDTTIECSVPSYAGTGYVDVICGGKKLVNPRRTRIGGNFEYLPTASTILLNNPFDSATYIGDGLVPGSGTYRITSSMSLRGDYSIHVSRSSTGTTSIRNSANINVSAYSAGVYVRYYQYIPNTTTASLGDQIKTFLFRRQAGDGQPGWIMTGIGPDFPDGDSSTMKFVSFIDNGIININSGSDGTVNQGRHDVTAGRWNEWIYWNYWDSGSSQGRCRTWLNGKMQFDVTHPNIGSTGSDYRLALGIAYAQNPTAMVETYIDDVWVGDGFPKPTAL